ncbi:MAG: MOSC domain-containing protein [Verrucomicrobia bacterium]|nr:MAG: MOSC domain-containing protein [Verrucomicrobiota bacterium]
MESPALRLESIATYPVKSCAAIRHESVEVGAFGLGWDRRWMVVDAAGRFVTQRTQPRLALVRVDVGPSALAIEAPGEPRLEIPLEPPAAAKRRVVATPATVWNDTVTAWDEGDVAAAWFSRWLGIDARLARFPDDAVRPVNPVYSPEPARTAFADGYPVLLATTASLGELNRRLEVRGALPVPMERFRPNLVVTGGGWEPFAEDGWKRIRIGAVEFDVAKPCTRCVMTTTDQSTGIMPEPGEPLATLATFRRWEGQVIFAQNLVHRRMGRLRVGDAVTVLE